MEPKSKKPERVPERPCLLIRVSGVFCSLGADTELNSTVQSLDTEHPKKAHYAEE